MGGCNDLAAHVLGEAGVGALEFAAVIAAAMITGSLVAAASGFVMYTLTTGLQDNEQPKVGERECPAGQRAQGSRNAGVVLRNQRRTTRPTVKTRPIPATSSTVSTLPDSSGPGRTVRVSGQRTRPPSAYS